MRLTKESKTKMPVEHAIDWVRVLRKRNAEKEPQDNVGFWVWGVEGRGLQGKRFIP